MLTRVDAAGDATSPLFVHAQDVLVSLLLRACFYGGKDALWLPRVFRTVGTNEEEDGGVGLGVARSVCSPFEEIRHYLRSEEKARESEGKRSGLLFEEISSQDLCGEHVERLQKYEKVLH